MRKTVLVKKALIGLILSVAVIGCSKSSNPLSSSSGTTPVSLSVAFSNSGTPVGLRKVSGVNSVDSLRIDSAVVVLQRIKFESHIDSVTVDTSGNGTDTETEDPNVTFMGPFIVHIRDTVAINFANQTLPAGTYTGIKFKIHRMQAGEKGEDSDEMNHHSNMMIPVDTSLAGSSIIVWGAVKKNGVWRQFTYRYNDELEFKIKGNFTVASASSTVQVALNFNMGSWFVDPYSGGLLDPTNTSGDNLDLIRHAIKMSFENGRGGDDGNGDGHLDD